MSDQSAAENSGQAVDRQEQCEGCREPSVGYDPQGVPLCAECAATTLDLNKQSLTDNPPKSKRKLCPLHGQFQTNCGCTDEQIAKVTHTALSRQAVDRQEEWIVNYHEIITPIGSHYTIEEDHKTAATPAKRLKDEINAALAAERQRAEQAERLCEAKDAAWEKLESDLLSALAAIEKHNKFVREFPDDPAYEIELDEAMK